MTGDNATDEPNEGEQMHAAIGEFISAIYDHENPTVVTRFVVIAEADDGEARWVEVVAFGADGHSLPEWESIGLIEYAKRIEQRTYTHAADDEDTDD